MDLQHVAQHVADTVRVHDTITVHDTVRVAASSGGFDWRPALTYTLGSGFGVTIGVALVRWWWKRRAADRRAGLEAFDVRRRLRASFEKHPTEPANTGDLIAWARDAGAGFDGVTNGFATLTQIAPEASGGVEDAITDAYARFLNGAGAINRVFNVPIGTGIAVNAATDATLRPAYRELVAAITALGRAMRKRLRTSDDGYNKP